MLLDRTVSRGSIRKPKEESTDGGLTKNSFKGMSKDTFLATADSLIDDFLRENYFPKKYNGKSVKGMVKSGKIIECV